MLNVKPKIKVEKSKTGALGYLSEYRSTGVTGSNKKVVPLFSQLRTQNLTIKENLYMIANRRDGAIKIYAVWTGGESEVSEASKILIKGWLPPDEEFVRFATPADWEVEMSAEADSIILSLGELWLFNIKINEKRLSYYINVNPKLSRSVDLTGIINLMENKANEIIADVKAGN